MYFPIWQDICLLGLKTLDYMKYWNWFLRMVVFIHFLQSCQPTIDEPAPLPETVNAVDSVSTDVITQWVDVQNQLFLQTPSFDAPIEARVIAYTYLALYEAMVPALPGFQSLSSQLNGMPTMPAPDMGLRYHWPTVANVAQYTILAELFVPVNTSTKTPLDSLRRTFEQKFNQQIPQDVLERSIRHGAAVGSAIWQYARQDGGGSAWSNRFPSSFSPSVGQAFWRSTTNQPLALLPQWREVRTFLGSNSNVNISNPPSFSSRNDSPFFAEAKQVYDRTRALSTAQQQNMARWAEGHGTLGHPLAMVRSFTHLAKERNLKTSQLIVGLARLGLAGHDAYVQSWKGKFLHQRVRPQSYLNETLDPSWKALVSDNNTPEFGSSWMTYLGAWSEVVKASFGTTGTVHLSNSIQYTDLSSLLTDASNAQWETGLHFPSTLPASLAQGSTIGKNCVGLTFRKP